MNFSIPLARSLSRRTGSVRDSCEVTMPSGPLPVNSMAIFMEISRTVLSRRHRPPPLAAARPVSAFAPEHGRTLIQINGPPTRRRLSPAVAAARNPPPAPLPPWLAPIAATGSPRAAENGVDTPPPLVRRHVRSPQYEPKGLVCNGTLPAVARPGFPFLAVEFRRPIHAAAAADDPISATGAEQAALGCVALATDE